LPALQYDIKVKDNIGIAHHVLIFMGEKFSNGLFAWAIPLGDETYKVGVATKGRTLVRMKYVLKTLERIGITPLHVIKTYGGTVYTGGLVKHLLRGDLLYIGDSAGQTKPTTGGGLVYLSIAARLLASALIRNDPTLYEKNVRATLGHETSLQFALRKALNNLSDPELDEIFRTVKEMHGEELISRIGSMDRQAFLIREIGFKYLFERPSLVFKLLFKVLLD
jgi:Dehydrogenases (flavoproteins)